MSPVALDVIECLPTMDELDSESLVEELGKASVAEWLRAWDTLTMFEATVCRRS